MLGGEKDGCHKSANMKIKPFLSNKTGDYMKNVDNVIELVVNDVAGKTTGISTIDKISKNSLEQQKKSTLEKVYYLNTQNRLFYKPAPASKKKLVKPIHSINILNDDQNMLQRQSVSVKPQSAGVPSFHTRDNDIISTVIHQAYPECSVDTIDLFSNSPLEDLICMGCYRKYNGPKLFSIDSSKDVHTVENFRYTIFLIKSYND